MGGFDDHNKEDAFSADHPISSSSFGLREAIHEAEMQRENDIQDRAQALFNKMKVLQKVRKATKEGRREISINFPKTKRFGPDTSLKKGISGADVIIALMAMISEDDIFVKTKAGQTGGCCEEPEGVMIYACPDPHCSQVLPDSRIDYHIQHYHRFYSCALCSSDKPRHEHELVDSGQEFTGSWIYMYRNDERHITYGVSWDYAVSDWKAPMFRHKSDLVMHIKEHHAYFCRPCAVYLGLDATYHLLRRHSKTRKGWFTQKNVQTMTVQELERVEEPYADLIKEWKYERNSFSYAGHQCKNCGGDYESLSDEDYYISMELTW